MCQVCHYCCFFLILCISIRLFDKNNVMFFSVHFKKQPQNNSLKFKISENPETIVFKDKNGKISESTFTQIYIRKLVCFLNKIKIQISN